MRREVLQRGDQVHAVVEGAVALEAADGGDAEAGDEVGVLAERLLDAAPAGVPRHVHDGREGLVRAADAGLLGHHAVEALDEVGVEGGAEGDRLRE